MNNRVKNKLNLQNLHDEAYEIVGLIELAMHKGEISEQLREVLADKIERLASQVSANTPSQMEEGESTQVLDYSPEKDAKEKTADETEHESAEFEESGEGLEEYVEIIEEEEEETEKVSEILREKVILEKGSRQKVEKRGRPVFTLNDRFLFTRELFGGDRSAFDAALLQVVGMDSVEEMEDYFYHDLGWDEENEEVQKFLTILSTIF